MKNILIILISLFTIYSYTAIAQQSINLQPYKYNSENKIHSKLNSEAATSSGASGGFNLGFATIEDNVGFAIGVFAEIKAGEIAFIPQGNYWNSSNQSNFELAGLARFYLSKAVVKPYIDGGLGVNFYNSDLQDFTKLSIIIGGGVELDNVSSSFSLLFDGKYKLIINDPGNISTFVFTAGMKFPFK